MDYEFSKEEMKLIVDEFNGAMQFRHLCIKTPACALIEYNPKRKESCFTLTFIRRETKGVLQPRTISITYPIDFCPYCGIRFTSNVFLNRNDNVGEFREL